MIKKGSVVRYINETSTPSMHSIGTVNGDLLFIINEKQILSDGRVHFQFKNLRTGLEHKTESSMGLFLPRQDNDFIKEL